MITKENSKGGQFSLGTMFKESKVENYKIDYRCFRPQLTDFYLLT